MIKEQYKAGVKLDKQVSERMLKKQHQKLRAGTTTIHKIFLKETIINNFIAIKFKKITKEAWLFLKQTHSLPNNNSKRNIKTI